MISKINTQFITAIFLIDNLKQRKISHLWRNIPQNITRRHTNGVMSYFRDRKIIAPSTVHKHTEKQCNKKIL